VDSLKIVPVFLLGSEKSLFGEDRAEQDAKSDAILERLSLSKEQKVLVRREEELLEVNIHGTDGFAIFPYCSERFSLLIYLAETGMPMIIVGDDETFSNALETYEYLSNHKNVQVVFNQEEFREKIKVIKAERWLMDTKICLFDTGEWKLNGTAWLKNPIIAGKLITQNIKKATFLEAYRNADRTEAEKLARKWTAESKVLEPSLEDIVKSARVYIAMKTVIHGMNADAAYVLWCGQFTKELGTKMCFALAKLADDGFPVGCWRGENLLPLLILHSITNKPIFVCEAQTRQGNIISLRHCFAPGTIASCKYVLRNWRDMQGTVTGYCQLPKGEVTLVNCGIGDKLVIVKGKVLDCKDLGGENCRITVWVELENAEPIGKFVGREFAMAYGDYAKEAKEIGRKLGLTVL
jgi:hypothetical protein